MEVPVGSDGGWNFRERHVGRDEYLSRVTLVAKRMMEDRLLLSPDLSDVVDQAAALYDGPLNRIASNYRGTMDFPINPRQLLSQAKEYIRPDKVHFVGAEFSSRQTGFVCHE